MNGRLPLPRGVAAGSGYARPASHLPGAVAGAVRAAPGGSPAGRPLVVPPGVARPQPRGHNTPPWRGGLRCLSVLPHPVGTGGGPRARTGSPALCTHPGVRAPGTPGRVQRVGGTTGATRRGVGTCYVTTRSVCCATASPAGGQITIHLGWTSCRRRVLTLGVMLDLVVACVYRVTPSRARSVSLVVGIATSWRRGLPAPRVKVRVVRAGRPAVCRAAHAISS